VAHVGAIADRLKAGGLNFLMKDQYMRLHGIVAGADEDPSAQVLIDPFDGRLDLPTLPVELANCLWGQVGSVGQEGDSCAVQVPGDHAARKGGVTLSGLDAFQRVLLVAIQLRVEPVYRVRVTSLKARPALGSDWKFAARRMQSVKSTVVDVSSIHLAASALPGSGRAQSVYLMGLSIADVDETWDRAKHFQRHAQNDRCLREAKRCPQRDITGVEIQLELERT
jgi:hypothetical protein